MATSTIPFFGRAWKLTVKYVNGTETVAKDIFIQDAWTPESLRITFDVMQNVVGSPFWFADISIYNLNDPTSQNYLLNAVWATLEAGYQTGPGVRSIIWDGPVMQAMFDRENVTDYRITLNCVATIPQYEAAIVENQIGPMTAQADAVSKMLSSIDAPTLVASPLAQQAMAAVRYPRGKTMFGRVGKYLTQIADTHFMAQWQDGKQSYLSELNSSSAMPAIVYSPPLPPGFQGGTGDQSITRTIIDTPRQSPFGVIFRVLLDPRLHVGLPPMLVQIDNAIIAQMKAAFGEIRNPVDASGLCVVGQVRHIGDSRGNEWYTEVAGFWRNYTTNLLNGFFSAQSQGAQ